jgi:hypothetical protein
LPDFETFQRQLSSIVRQPFVTIRRGGTLALSTAAHAALGSPAAVGLLYDVDARVIGVQPVDIHDERAHFVRAPTRPASGPFLVSAAAFIRYYDIDLTITLRRCAYVVDGTLCVDLDLDVADAGRTVPRGDRVQLTSDTAAPLDPGSNAYGD